MLLLLNRILLLPLLLFLLLLLLLLPRTAASIVSSFKNAKSNIIAADSKFHQTYVIPTRLYLLRDIWWQLWRMSLCVSVCTSRSVCPILTLLPPGGARFYCKAFYNSCFAPRQTERNHGTTAPDQAEQGETGGGNKSSTFIEVLLLVSTNKYNTISTLECVEGTWGNDRRSWLNYAKKRNTLYNLCTIYIFKN